MIITCGQCQARFKVAPEQIKVTGSKVRCSHCLSVFTVFRPGGPEAEAEAPGETPGLFGDEETGSQKARRERRRLLYAGPDGEGGEEDDQPEDDGWTEAGLDETSGHPPLRRRPQDQPSAEQPAAEQPSAEQPEAEQPSADQPEAEQPLTEPASTGPAGDDLGLGADPTRPFPDPPPRRVGDELPPVPGSNYNGEIRAAVTKVKGRRHGLFLGLAIFCAALAIGLYYLSSRPEPLALSEGDGPPPAPAAPGLPAPAQPPPAQAAGPDPRGIEHITFTPKDNLKHFYRKNEKEGELLIITGRVRNSYPEPRSFIRLRGLLLDQNGSTLADRFIYAGNLISEEDLTTLRKEEIMALLNIKGGKNNQNMNIAPGREVPFMVVFDKVPASKDEYRIIPVGSSPADQ
ncbi:MAG: zinc-ribbon domain-containing protein [Candidatus Adiutrix sp.]|jgi:predicted Zn finger-like uncharacterized protein|nr:zinc-ribbon domain-containing protein [Candidatus Adiutrix sp.]